ncbi:MAG: tRNA (cytidine(34)-2'-O)-methyltransferase [Terrimicrobiaceae bacterium]
MPESRSDFRYVEELGTSFFLHLAERVSFSTSERVSLLARLASCAGRPSEYDRLVSFHVVLVEPEIPPNTGNIARLCLAAGAVLHLVEPLGFSIDARALRRAGMDYWEQCDVRTWKSFADFQRDSGLGRLFFLTTKAEKPYWEADFHDGDALIFGRESRGLPESLLHANKPHCLTIPMAAEARSLNLATATGIVLYEAIRQTQCPR